MKSLVRVVMGMLLLGLGALAYLNWRTNVEQSAENERLRNQLATMEAPLPPPSSDEELVRLRSEQEQLPKLRGEVTRLRAASNELAKARQTEHQLRSEIQQLRAASASAAASTGTPADTSPTAGYVTRDQLAFAGYGSAEASLNSMLWAMRQGNPEAFLAGATPEMQASLRKRWEQGNITPEQITAEMQTEAKRMQGMQILQSVPQADGTVLLTVQMDQTRKDGTAKQEQEKMVFEQIGNEWKLSPKKSRKSEKKGL